MKIKIKPFLKWAGNKYRIVNRIKEHLPKSECYVEPFLGSGALFLNTNYCEYVLADLNSDLINLYTTLQSEGKPFISYCKTFFTKENNISNKYYSLREVFNNTESKELRAALFLYLNRHGYNGLCRYNSKGIYNVPFGNYLKPYFPKEEMCLFYERIKNVLFKVADFNDTMNNVIPGSVVYCDPPYVPLSKTANFVSYVAGGFTLKKHVQLAKLAYKLAKQGTTVIISNHKTDYTMELYEGAQIKEISVPRLISCKERKDATEILAIFKGDKKND